MASPFQNAGALPEPTEYAPLVMDRYITGLWTQRSPLRDAAVPFLMEKYYSAGRTDSLIDGVNIELTPRLSWGRRAGNSVYNSQSFPPIGRFFDFKPVIDGAEQVFVMADTAEAVYDATAPTPATSRKLAVWNKSAAAGKTFFQAVGNTLYMANGAENKKWILSSLIWKPATAYSNKGTFVDCIIDPNHNIQQAVGSFVVAIQSIAISAGVLTVTLDPEDENLPEQLNFLVGVGVTFADLTAANFLNGETVTIASVTPNGLGANTFTAAYAHADYASAADTGTITSGSGSSAAAQPGWQTDLGAVTVDGGAQWVCRGNYVQNWGIVAPGQAPNVAQTPIVTKYPLWAANTYYSTCYLIRDPSDHVQMVTKFGTTGAAAPGNWNDSGGITNDGSVEWTDQGSGIYAAALAVAAGKVIFTEASDGQTYFYRALNDGATGATPPIFPPALGQVAFDNGVEWRNIGVQAEWTDITSSSLSDGFAVIPLQNGGSIALGMGTSANGARVGLPTGYTTDTMLLWSTAGAGLAPTQITGVATATSPDGIFNATLQERNSAAVFPVPSNWACAAWTSNAAITRIVSGSYTFLQFTTQAGATLCFVLGTNISGPGEVPTPTGFVASQFVGIPGMCSVVNTGNALQSIFCELNPTNLALSVTYRDNSLNEWPGNVNVFGVFYQLSAAVTVVTPDAVTSGIILSVDTGDVAILRATVNDGASFTLPGGFGGVQSVCSANAQYGDAGDNDAHGMAICSCDGLRFHGKMQDGEGHQWGMVGNVFAFATLQTTTPVSGDQTINDSNGDLQTIAQSGLSGAHAPAWKPTRGSLTVDNSATWDNTGTYSAASTGGWTYAYAYRNLVDGSVSTCSKRSKSLTLNAGYYVTPQGVYSTDPQVGSVVIYRTDQAGSTLFYADEFPNVPSGGSWTYVDTLRDQDLTIEIEAATAHQNDPPPDGLTAICYHMGRIFGAVNNLLYYSDGPDVAASGNGNTAWNPVNVYVLPETLMRLEPVTLSNGALLCITTSEWWSLFGAGTSGNPFIRPTRYYSSCGLLHYDALDVVGATFYFVSNKSKLMSFDPSAGAVEAGFPIGDQFRRVTTAGTSAKLYDPATAFVAWYEGGGSANAEADQGDDTGLFVADGAVGWFRYSPISAPESGSVWSPFARIVGGTSAVQAVEVAPGIQNLLIGPAAAGPILYRDVSTNQDNGQNFDAPFATLGNIVLAQSGEVAEVAHVALDSIAVGTPPSVSLLFGEIRATDAVPFDQLEWTSADPPDLPESETLYSHRFSTLQNGTTPKCRHLQMRIEWTQENAPTELLSHAIYGAHHSERRTQ